MTPVYGKFKWIFLWVIIIAAGLLVGRWRMEEERKDKFEELLADARRCAIAFQPGELQRLTGTGADVALPEYIGVKGRLMRLRSVHPAVRFVYIFRWLPEAGKVVYLADSEPEGSKDLSLPGDVFPEAPQMPGLGKILRAEAPAATEGPVSDSFGTWVTGYSLIGPPVPAGETALVKELVGLDIAADSWNRDLFETALKTALYVWLLLGVPCGVVLALRRHGRLAGRIRRLSEAVEQSQSAVMIVDLHGCIEYANEGLCRQMGCSRRELVGRLWQDFKSETSLPAVEHELARRMQEGKAWEGDWSNRRKNGESYAVHGNFSPVRAPDGRVVGFIAVLQDVTELNHHEEALKEAKEAAEAADRAKGRFLATMSHEVRTPLNGIVGFTNLLLDTALTSEQREYVQTIRTSGEALVHLTGDILDFSRIESGKVQLEPAPCDIRGHVEDVLDILSSRAAQKGIQLLHWVDVDVPLQVMADAGRLRQVLINLVGNAIKFTPSGEVEVKVRVLTGKAGSLGPFGTASVDGQGQLVAELDDGSVALEFSVRDTGVGIAEDDKSKLFQPFSQVDSSMMRRYGGAGLGLAISRNLVQLMGGDIRLTSQTGKGSTFLFVVRAGRMPGALIPFGSQVLAGKRVAVLASSPAFSAELSKLVQSGRGIPVECKLDELAKKPWDLALVDHESLSSGVKPMDLVRTPGWRPERMFGLLGVTTSATDRQEFRRCFRMMFNKPVHHRALLELLGRTASSDEGESAAMAPLPPGLRVLLVEDDVVNQRLMKTVLDSLGCQWRMVEHGRACLEELAVKSYDAVLIDIHMPEMDGLMVTKLIRGEDTRPAARDVWIAVVTSDTRAEVREMALAAGANDFLCNPVTIAQAEAALRRLLKERGRTAKEDECVVEELPVGTIAPMKTRR